MSDNLRELYQETIFDHYRRPRNFGRPAGANREAQGYNPLCGDQVKVYLRVEDGMVKDAGFEGTGCAISTASASLMTESLKGRREEEALSLLQRFHSMVTGSATGDGLGKLEALAGVREFPERVKCATLAWHTMQSALEEQHGQEAVTTE